MHSFETHKFFCINCGRESIPLPRRESHKHKSMHRKDLYCPWCKHTVNHIECSTIEEEEEFKRNFIEGVYKDEADQSLAYERNSWFR